MHKSSDETYSSACDIRDILPWLTLRVQRLPQAQGGVSSILHM